MATDLQTILRLEVPLVVVLAERELSVREVRDLVPGTIIELPKHADDELEIRVNNRPIGSGAAVKVGENFGVRFAFVGDLTTRTLAMGAANANNANEPDEISPEDLAAALLSGQ